MRQRLRSDLPLLVLLALPLTVVGCVGTAAPDGGEDPCVSTSGCPGGGDSGDGSDASIRPDGSDAGGDVGGDVGGDAGGGGLDGGACNPGYASCDNNPANGCETQLGTDTNCASCGNACTTGYTCAESVCAKTYYVATNGSDSAAGDIGHPFATINKAWSVVSAGDVVYVRGGTYSFLPTTSLTNKSGTAGHLIKIWSYPGENPVIDYTGASFPGNQVFGIYLNNVSYLHLKGIRVTNITQFTDWPNYAIIMNSVSNSIFERMETDHIGGWGVIIGDSNSDDLFLNCDSHHNQDPLSSNPYGGSDGFEGGSHGASTSTRITFRGCRAWSNSDDGWDFRQADGIFKIESCWSFWNGYIPGTTTTGGNGDGYKLGGKTAPATTDTLRTVTSSLAFENRLDGFTPEPDGADLIFNTTIENCTSFGNHGTGYALDQYTTADTVKNSVDYKNGSSWRSNAFTIHDHNSMDVPIALTDADFQSVSSAGMDGPRKADGSLPDLPFLRPTAGSKLLHAGTNVGLPYSGTAPNIGAF